MGVNNPFGPPVMPSVITNKPKDQIAPDAAPEPTKVSEPVEITFNQKNEALEIVQKVLAEYKNIESDIPLTCYEYWAAKRRLA